MLSKVQLLALSAALAPVHAWFRMSCPGAISRERLDPVVSPGKVSGHTHLIAGGSNFGPDYSYEHSLASNCTSCTIREDLSNYWTPQLYVEKRDGTFEAVTIRNDGQDKGAGMTVYYFFEKEADRKASPFPKGFQMVSGDPSRRTYVDDSAAKAVSYYCDGNQAGGNTHAFPTGNCPGYLRAEIVMPACWDGVNVAPVGGKSHISHFDGDIRAGKCPSAFPVRLPQMLYEIEYDTNQYKDEWVNGKSPFMWAQGDRTGYGLHGDFTNGWNIDVLKKALDTCTTGSTTAECKAVSLITDWDESRACKKVVSVDEDVKGPLKKLPGCNPVTGAGETAKKLEGCTDVAALKGGAVPAKPSTGASSSVSASAVAVSVTTSAKAPSSTRAATSMTGPKTTLKPTTVKPATTARPTANATLRCPHNNCINQAFMTSSLAKPFCATYTAGTTTAASAIPTFLGNCGGKAADVSSACACLAQPSVYLGA